MSACFRRIALLLPLLAVGACRKAEVTTYRVPKETEAAMPPATAPASAPVAAPVPGMATTDVPTATGTGLTWTAPSHWQAKPASAMRKATYAIPGDGATAELSITAFPNDVGGELANFNRWRGQVELPPAADSDLTSAVTRLEHDGLKFGVVDLVGASAAPQRILAAWVPVGGATWFFKLLGPDAVVAKEKPAFIDFLNSVRPTNPTP